MKKQAVALILSALILGASGGAALGVERPARRASRGQTVTEEESEWRIGPRLGLNLSTLYGSQTTYKIRFGGTFGGMMLIPLEGVTEGLFLQPEAAFAMKGYSVDAGTGVRSDLRLNYVEAAALVRFKLGDSDFKPALLGGLSFGYLVSARQTKVDTRSGTAIDQDALNLFVQLDISAVLGMGFDFMLGEAGPFHTDARATIGFTPVDVTGANSGKNLAFGLYLAYSWGL